MGNVQAASIANQLLPIESYVGDVPALKFSHSLCATRFMKVGRVEHAGGPMIAKVFVLVDQTFSVELYQQQVLTILKRLVASPNCCPFSRIYVTPRSAILCRRFAKYTLHTRLSTRPFLLDVERRWIVFQLLRALDQCRATGVCHGDIKAENVLVSSSLWIQLTDFASFKPAFLPYDNPSTFTFFFDTSRRRSCNLAPERFRTSADINYAPRFPNDAPNIAEGLTEAMDVFAAGCVIAELLVDGRRTLFTLAQAVDYARVDDERAARAHVARLSHDAGVPEDFHTLLAAMLERNPARRLEELNNIDVSALFPAVFNEYLYEYLRDLNGKPDDIITKLYVDRNNYLPRLLAGGDESTRECAVLFTNYVTSSVRACRSLPAKMDAITLLHELAKVCPTLIGDRIVPYLTQVVSDAFPQARAESIYVLVEVLELYEPSVQEDCRLLIDFVFPKLKTVTLDTSNHVKSVLAGNLGRLAMISLRYMEEGFRKLREEMTATGGPSNTPPADEFVESERLLIQTERGALHAVVNELFVNLCGSDNEVRHGLFEPANLELLCCFSGADRATDILMHMITVLNDKPDWRMRAAFFASCPVVAGHLGQLRCGKILPFLQQGLQDSQEFVIYECLCCIYALCDRQLLSKRLVFDIMQDVAPFLVHPNKWLRVAVANILTVFQSTFDVADIYVKIRPLVRAFFREDLIVFSTARVVLKALVEPVPRHIWNYLVGYPRICELVNLLENDRTLNRLSGSEVNGSAQPFALDGAPSDLSASISAGESQMQPVAGTTLVGASGDVDGVRQRLAGLGMDAEVAEKLLALRNVLCSVNLVQRGGGSSSLTSDLSNPAYVRLQKQPRAHRRVFNMATGECRIINSNGALFRDFFGDPLAMSGSGPRPNSATGSGLQANISASRFMLEETLQHKRDTYLRQLRVTSAGSAHEIAKQLADAIADGDSGDPAAAAAAASDSDDMETGTARARSHGHLFNPFTVGAVLSDDVSGPSDDRVGGPAVQLLCTTNEHTDKIVGLTLHPDLNSFASCGRDGLVKLWAADALMGASHTVPAAMSRSTFRYGRAFTACGYLPASGHLALASEDRVLQLCDQNVDRVLRTFVADERDGAITKLQCHGELIYAITHHSAVYSFDPRTGTQPTRQRGALTPIWRGQLRNSYGLITSFSVDPTAQHWAAFTGSSATTKNMILWDLRFTGLEVAAWSTNNAQAITLGSWPLARGGQATQLLTAASKEAEVSLWDLTTQTRTDVLWPAHTKPLVYVNESVTTALTPSCVNPDVLLTGDSDGALRCWNLRRADRCSYLCGPRRKRAGQPLESEIDTQCHIRYEQRQYADRLLRVHVELLGRTDALLPTAGQDRDARPAHLLSPTDYHHDGITDLLSVWSELVVSSGRDGVVKLWKMI